VRIDPDECRDPDLLAAEVRRLQAVIAAGEPTLTDNDPVAWAVVYPNYLEPYEYESDARESASDDQEVIPLYRSPTLTDAEREAIEFFDAIHNEGYGIFAKHTATLRTLLERLT